MALELRFVDRIHTRLLARYGSKWINLYAGVDADLVKADWSEQLARVSHDAIRYALDNLPAENPPNVGQFRALCNRQPPATVPALPAPPLVPEPARVAALVAAVGNPKPQDKTPAQVCAEGLRKRMADGHKLTQNQRWVLDCCERSGMTEAQVMDAFSPVPADVLPPAMRAAA